MKPTGRALLLTQGDPAGIGIELAFKAWMRRQEDTLPAFGIVAGPQHLQATAAALGWDVPIRTVEASGISGCFDSALPVIAIKTPVQAKSGRPDASSAKATIESIETAVGLVQAGQASAVITNPIAKHVLYEAGFAHPGHTEFLAYLAGQADGQTYHPVMMLWCEAMAVVPVTVHISLADVPGALTQALIVKTGRIVAKALRERFGIAHPRLAIAGLNPHAGESGALGSEDAAIIMPAVAELQAEGLAVEGPFPADTMFHARARQTYDVALAMYHDQALIPIKTIAFDEAVNVTLGLPFVRTSPDHGTGFDIAGKGIARPDSLIAAIRLAARLSAGQVSE